MKKNILTLFVLSLVFISCSHDSSTPATPDNGDSTPTTYFPLKSSNNWHYSNLASGSTTMTSDILSVGVDNVLGGFTYKKMIGTDATDTSLPSNGSLCSLLNNNNLRIDGSSLKLTGTLNYPLLSSPITININDFIIFKQNATSGTVLSTQSGTVNQTINNNGTDIPITIDYVLTSTALENLTSYVSNTITYNDIKKVKLVLNAKVTTSQTISGIPVTLTILSAQDVFTSTMYFCNGKGIAYNNTVFHYALTALPPGVTLPPTIPSTFDATQEDFLTTYVLN